MFRKALINVLFLCAAGVAAQAQDPSIAVPPGAHLLLAAKGEGTQIYACTEGRWTLKAPDAKLLDANGMQIGKHFAGPTWQLNDGSEVKGKLIASHPAPDGTSVPWLLLEAVPDSAKGRLASVAYIRRTNTKGGAAPKEACSDGTISVPYQADYSFYAAR